MGIRIVLFDGKGCNSFKTGGKNLYEISNLKKPVYRLMHPYASKKLDCRKTHFLSPVQKKKSPYIEKPHMTPGLFNNRIRSWLAALSLIYPYSLDNGLATSYQFKI